MNQTEFGAAAVRPEASPQAASPSLAWLVRRTIHLLAPAWRKCVLIGLGMLLQLSYPIFLAFSFKLLVDNAILPRNGAALFGILGAVAVLFVISAAADTGYNYLLTIVNSQVIHQLRLRMYRQLQRMSLRFYAQMGGGDLMSRFATDVASIELALGRAMPTLIGSTLRMLISSAIMIALDWRLAAITFLSLPIALIGPKMFGRRANDATGQRKAAEDHLLSVLQEQVAAQPVIKAFRLQATTESAIQQTLNQLERQAQQADFLARWVGRVTDSSQKLVQVIIIGAGATLAFYGAVSVGSLLAFFGMVHGIGNALSSISDVLPDLIQAANSLHRIDDLLVAEADLVDRPDAAPLPSLRDAIEFENVLFQYTHDQAILQQVSCRIPIGQSVAFVGRSGSGKSTMLSLIMRLYDPSYGTVRIDGHDLRAVTQSSLHGHISVVFQESMLFNTTVRENIRFGRLAATDADVIAAAQAAEIHEAILRLPQQYDTVVGERGGQLSGGQRQRIALARAIIGNPAVLILDEATSALDPEAEAAINATLERLAQQRTVIAATHRLAAIQQADQIYVMDHGRIIEQGTHPTLVDQAGIYAHLWEQQRGFTLSQDGRSASVTAERLRAIALFEPLSDQLLAMIASHFVTERIAAGSEVFAEDDPGDAFYIIVRGTVEVLQRDASGQQHCRSVLQDGDFFGEIALLADIQRTATVRARVASTFLTLTRPLLLEVLAANPALRERLETIAAERFAELHSADLRRLVAELPARA